MIVQWLNCGCAIFFLLGGLALLIVALVMKGVPLGANKIIPTAPACIAAGSLMLIPLCCGYGGLMGYGMYLGFEYGLEHAKMNPGRQMTVAEQMQLQQQVQERITTPAVILLVGSTLVSLGIAAGVALTSIKPREAGPGNVGYQPPDQGQYRRGGPGNWPAGS
jgi:hypothetical protein